MAPTIKEVAEKCKVSTATVSRALRGLPNVTPSTRNLVIKTAEEMGYSLDSIASSLRSGKTMNIGIVMPLADTWFYSKLATASETILNDSDYYAVRYSMNSLGGQSEFFKWLSKVKRVDGLILATMTLSKEDVDILRMINIPIVTVETKTDFFPSVTTNNVLAAKMATQYLLNLGHESIGVITGLHDDPLKFSVPQERLLVYQSALNQYEIEIRPELQVAGNFSFAGGAEATVDLLSVHSPPTAILTFSDEMAIGAMKTIREMNLKIPEDISVIGFDDHEVAEFVGLTTIKQPVALYGEKAATILLDQIDSKEKHDLIHVTFDTKMIVRSTTGPVTRK
jgi:DNA-binding LacI/PurR family transcriptional regulator